MNDVLILSATSGNNMNLANLIADSCTKLEMSTKIINLEEIALPLYTPSEEKNGIPDAAKKLADDLISSKSFVVLAPEYNGSIPAVVVNAISWISRSGEDWREAFNDKFSVVGTHSGGGGQKVVMALRQQLEHLGSVVLPRPVITNYSKQYNPESGEQIFSQLKKYL